jgi:hypothetical protein
MDLKNIFESVDSLAGMRGVAYLCFLSLLTLGPLEIFVAYPKLFLELDTIKLVLLGLALTLPATFLAIMALVMGEGKTVEDTQFEAAFGAGAACVFLSGALGIGITALWHGGFWPFAIAEGSGILFAWYVAHDAAPKDRRTNRLEDGTRNKEES